MLKIIVKENIMRTLIIWCYCSWTKPLPSCIFERLKNTYHMSRGRLSNVLQALMTEKINPSSWIRYRLKYITFFKKAPLCSIISYFYPELHVQPCPQPVPLIIHDQILPPLACLHPSPIYRGPTSSKLKMYLHLATRIHSYREYLTRTHMSRKYIIGCCCRFISVLVIDKL
jgi:hypothetical protein